ncbi:tetraacyldisaccharide 4'-kinase [Campylobacter pinnipediorum]|uniref:tetraacyldisaccharide 4'-kinase n=1 Tax=Campylobacter pinnipediorum TaxID=1965231 RepID=UPI000B34A8A9|nr:tetraacyldisaccharide 4'-kinase [Campylobacter pinnipediorum]
MVFNKLNIWVQRYFYYPNIFDKILSFFLIPITILYTFAVYCKKKFSKEIEFQIPIISIGNITLGGSGKTPLCIAIANEFKDGFIILRGYKRQSSGLVCVCINGSILTDVLTSGDEAMEYATNVKNANVIVSENRDIAIQKAKELGAKYILLDDGFGKFHIKKFNILIKPKQEPFFDICIPSGAYRYPFYFYKFADFIAQEDISYFKNTKIINPTQRMVLVSAIANPNRLDEFKQICVESYYFVDHYSFKKDELLKIIKEHNATSILVTNKDFVKIKDFGLNVSLIKLQVVLGNEFKELINSKIL